MKTISKVIILKVTFANNIAGVIFLKKKDKKEKEDIRKNKEIIDLTSYISPEILKTDVLGSYTGVTEEMYYDGIDDEPIQDADDL